MKILTALNNIELNKSIKNILKENKEIKVEKDIVYKDGIIEYLTNNSNINMLLLDSTIPGDIEIYHLIKSVLEINKYIEIIAILKEDDLDLRKFLSGYSIEKILIKDRYSLNDIIELITNDSSVRQKSLEKELEELRNLVFEQSDNSFKKKIKKKISSIKENSNKRQEERKRKREEKLKEEENKLNKQIIKRKLGKKSKANNEILIDEVDKRLYFNLSDNIQKHNISSIDITIRIKKEDK